MKISRASSKIIGLVLATTGVVAGAAVTVGRPPDAWPRAEAALIDHAGTPCLQRRHSLQDSLFIKGKIDAAAANAGWVVPNLIFVGDIGAAAEAIKATIVAEDSTTHWFLTDEGGAQILGLVDRGTLGKSAYVINERVFAIRC